MCTFNIVDVDIFFLNTWSKLVGFDFLLILDALHFGTDGVYFKPLYNKIQNFWSNGCVRHIKPWNKMVY
jgi:hypothetical protein